MKDKRDRFYKVYNNLPLGVRDEVVAVVNVSGYNEPISWRVAKLEVDENTELSKKILENLEKLKII